MLMILFSQVAEKDKIFQDCVSVFLEHVHFLFMF
jgi:hypothetical protein